MYRRRKFEKIFILGIPSALFIFKVIMSLPAVANYLQLATPQRQYIISVIFIIIFILFQFCYVYRPYRKFKMFEKIKWGFLDDMYLGLSKIYKRNRVDLRINVMVPLRKNKMGKDGKLYLFKKRFFTLWNSKNMDYDSDCHISLMLNQGVCGEAYKIRGRVAADMTIENPDSYNLCPDQIERTKDLKFIVSTPIFEQDEENLRKSDKIIGVVNFDSKSPGSEKLVKDIKHAKTFYKKTRAFADLCSKLM